MRASGDSERRARLALSFLAQPGDPVLGAALRSFSADELLSAVTGTDDAGCLCPPPSQTSITYPDSFTAMGFGA